MTTVLPAPLTLQRSHTVQNYFEFCTRSEGKADLHSQDTHTQGRTRLLRGGHTLRASRMSKHRGERDEHRLPLL